MLPKENFNFQNLTNTIPGILVDFFCIIDAAKTIMMVIKSELGHYYLTNKKTFPCFYPVYKHKRKAMEESYVWNIWDVSQDDTILHFSILSVQFSFPFEFLHTNARESWEEQEML